jgi:hypothetical protein
MDKPPPPPLRTKNDELIDSIKTASEFPTTASSEDRGMGSDSWRVAPSNAGLGSDAHETMSKFPATGSSEDHGMGSDSWLVAPSNAGSDAQKTALKFPATASARSFKETSNPEDKNRALFIAAMPDSVRRDIAFNVVERNCTEQFAEGEDGVRLYVRLLSDVRSANVAEAVDEFERRFAPMLDQQALQAWKTITAPFKRI